MAGAIPVPFTFAGRTYRAARLSAFDQHAILRLLSPVMEEFRQRTRVKRHRPALPAEEQMRALCDVVGGIGVDTLALIFSLCLGSIEREDEGMWQPIYSDEDEMGLFPDLTAGRLVALTVRTALLNLTPFLMREPVDFKPSSKLSYSHVGLNDGLSWLMMPVERGMCRYESLKDGTLDLADIALMNDQLAVSAENMTRAQKAAEEEAERKR